MLAFEYRGRRFEITATAAPPEDVRSDRFDVVVTEIGEYRDPLRASVRWPARLPYDAYRDEGPDATASLARALKHVIRNVEDEAVQAGVEEAE